MRRSPLALVPLFLLSTLSLDAAELPREKNSLGCELVLIPAGEFDRGMTDSHKLNASHRNTMLLGPDLVDERPSHPVKISRGFWIATREVTVRDFKAFVEETKYRTDAESSGKGALRLNPPDKESIDRFVADPACTWRSPGFEQTDDHPVTCVSWKDAVAFCEWLSKKEKAKYRLPTEAEWEYAARAGTNTIYLGGDLPETIYAYGNVADAALEQALPGMVKRQQSIRLKPGEGDGVVYTAPVGKFQANAWGLFDTHGNVWEWCSDRYYDRYYDELLKTARKKGSYAKPQVTVDPQGPETTPQHKHGDWRSMRGGSWCSGPMASRSVSRAYGEAGDAFCYAGFRVVKEAAEGEAPASPFADPAEAAVWKWLLERAGRQEHIEKDSKGKVKWVGFYDAEKKRGDYYSGSLDLDPEGYVVKLTFNAAHFSNDDLAKLAPLKKLKILTAWHNGWVKEADKTPYSGAGLVHLKGLPLEAVNFGGSWFNDEGMAAANQLPKLRELQAYHCRVTDEGVKALKGNQNLTRLVIGPQYSEKISERSLADVATIGKLEELDFNEAIATWEGGLKHLAARKELKRVKFDQGFIAPEDLEKLKAALPSTKIEYVEAKPEHVEQMKKAAAARAK